MKHQPSHANHDCWRCVHAPAEQSEPDTLAEHWMREALAANSSGAWGFAQLCFLHLLKVHILSLSDGSPALLEAQSGSMRGAMHEDRMAQLRQTDVWLRYNQTS